MNIDTTTDTTRVNISDAAKRLGTTEAAVRMRIRRGKLDHVKDADSRLWVLLPTEQATQHNTTPDATPIQQPTQQVMYERSASDQELIDALNARIEAQERQIKEKDSQITAWVDQAQQQRLMIARLEDRVLALPQSTQRATTAGKVEMVDSQAASPQATTKAPWWRFWERQRGKRHT